MSASLPLTAVLLLLFLLLAASAVPASAGGNYRGRAATARMVIIRRAPGTRVGGGGARGSNEWRHGRRLEDEVAPELEFGGGMLGAGDGGGIGYGALDKDRPGCQSGSQCAAHGGGSYTRGCTYKDHCPH